ncbi:MAG: hypothetical protein LBB55_06470, partial [Zoogloeaceae bacterium]|nr:hypothetical protein [Zoogloeaceae bacterium]
MQTILASYRHRPYLALGWNVLALLAIFFGFCWLLHRYVERDLELTRQSLQVMMADMDKAARGAM